MVMNCRLIGLFFLVFFLCGCQVYQPAAAISQETVPASHIAETTLTTEPPLKTPVLGSTLTLDFLTATPTLKPTASPMASPTPAVETSLLFTGVIVPARCVQAALDTLDDPDYPYEEVSSIIQEADLAIGTLNATIGDYSPHTGCVPTYVLVGSANNADALARAGFDAMSVATNHIKNCALTNCGDRAFFETLENLQRVGIAYVGAGNNHEEAMRPLVITQNGIRFGIVSLGQIEPMAFAGPDRPGIAILNSENLKAAVDAARQVSDVVIAMPHWGPEDVAVPNWIQRGLARQFVEAGADVVVGNHTHVVQAIQEIDGVPVFYGLGNFVFDQGLRDHQQGVILVLKFQGKQYTGYELIPTHVDQDGRVRIAESEEAQEILQRIEDASRAVRENR